MKPQDVIVLLKMAISEDGESQTYASMAQSLKISAAEIHAATQRAAAAGLLTIVNPRERKVNREKFLRWLEEAAATSFPAKLGPIGLGLPTGLTAVHLPEIQIHTSELPFIWPSPEGAVRGKTIKPLYKSAPFAARQDRALHECLALVDLLRIGTAREKVAAVQELERRIKRLENAPLMKSSGSPFDIHEQEIVEWSRRFDAPGLLPNLIRRIILDLEPIARIRFGGDKAVYHSDFDGELLTQGSSRFADTPQSFWEISVREDAGQKIKGDFKKRAMRGDGTSTLVFLTAKLLTPKQRQEILAQLSQSANWKDVRVYDAIDLAQWLIHAIPAAVWFREQMGTDTIGLETADDILDNWRGAARVQPEVTALGREPEKEKFLAWLQNPTASALHIRAETIEECVLFVVSAITSSEAHKEQWIPRIIIARQEEAWKRLLARLTPNPARPLLLIPMFPEFDGVLVKTTGHFVLVSSEPGTSDEHTDLYLRPYPREELERFLAPTRAGGVQSEARQLALDSGGKLTSLVRLVGGKFPRSPAWLEASSTPGRASIVCGLLLGGAWDPRNENDKRILRTLCDANDDDIEREINFLLGQTSDPPLREQGYAQKWRSHADAWRLLSPYLTETQLGRFQKTCIEVLAFSSKKYELAPDKRVYASAHGVNDPFSSTLRQGLAESLAWLRVNKDRLMADHIRDKASNLVCAVLKTTLTSDWKRWATLGNILTTLAEADSKSFLSYLKAILRDSKNDFAPLFKQQTQDSFFCEFIPSGLLWALQTIAWYDIDFSELVKLLVELTKLDMEPSKSTHTPFSVLAEIFHPLAKRCAVSNATRIRELQRLCATQETVAWKLLTALAEQLSHGGCIMQNMRPRFAVLGSLPQDFEEYSPDEANAFYQSMLAEIRRMLEEVPARVCDLLDSQAVLLLVLECLSKPEHLALFRSKSLAEVRHIQDHLRTKARFLQLQSHNTQLVDEINKVIRALEPNDPLVAKAWLFSQNARLTLEDFKTDFAKLDADWEQQRQDVVASIPNDAKSLDTLLKVARAAPDPNLLGESVAQSALADTLEHAIWAGPLLGNDADVRFAAGFVLKRFLLKGGEGWPWLRQCLERLHKDKKREIILRLLRFVPSSGDVRDWLEQKMPDAIPEYWKACRYVFPRDLRDASDFQRCVRHFMEAGNWMAAADLTASVINKYPDAETAVTLLEHIRELPGATADLQVHLASQAWHLDVIFKWLNEHAPLEYRERLVGLEIHFFSLFQSANARQLVFDKMSHEPLFYMELLELTYCAASAIKEEKTPTAQEENAARVAWRINQAWAGYPGDSAVSASERDLALTHWCEEVMKLGREKDRADITEVKVGEVLSRVPPHEDGIWPCRVARVFLSKDLDHIRSGLRTGKFNCRGVVTGSGGVGERELAAKYRADAERLRLEWPETAKLLDDLAGDYDQIAAHAEKEHELFE